MSNENVFKITGTFEKDADNLARLIVGKTEVTLHTAAAASKNITRGLYQLAVDTPKGDPIFNVEPKAVEFYIDIIMAAFSCTP